MSDLAFKGRRLTEPPPGYYRDPPRPYMLGLTVPPGFTIYVVSEVPWTRWTGEPPRLHYRAPFELLEVDQSGPSLLRARFRNPSSSPRPLCLMAAVDWPVWPTKRTAAVRGLLRRSA